MEKKFETLWNKEILVWKSESKTQNWNWKKLAETETEIDPLRLIKHDGEILILDKTFLWPKIFLEPVSTLTEIMV